MFSSSDLRVGTYAPLQAMAPHSHDEASFGVVIGGDFVERIGRSERHYTDGCVTFAPAGVIHAQQFGAGGARQIIIRPQESWLVYLSDAKMKLGDSPFIHAPVFRHLGRKLLDEISHDDDFAAVAGEGIVLEIVAAFGRAGAAMHISAHPPAWLRAARDYLHANACAALTMKQIARAAGRHEIHLAREFRRYFGMPVGAYQRRLKAEEAARLLTEPRADITEIALRCGFASHSHLCRVFKAHFGVTPSQYRTRH